MHPSADCWSSPMSSCGTSNMILQFRKWRTSSLESQGQSLTTSTLAKNSTMQADASKHGLGTVPLQNGKPISYASRFLTDSETCYAHLKREMNREMAAAAFVWEFVLSISTKYPCNPLCTSKLHLWLEFTTSLSSQLSCKVHWICIPVWIISASGYVGLRPKTGK